ncbi:hypothetical protein LCGC14_0860750 [marine sediment metagenome]|uniref:Uncharacterized protein n=1 Tax=marine sediment metagenome TaxID=412755 RepID=A0A0F9PSY4_9ZZZZ
MTKYRVGTGGTSKDTWDEYDDLADAEAACERMAEEQADEEAEEGSEPEPVDLYENDGPAGAPPERGACPVGDCGGYWPHIVEVS